MKKPILFIALIIAIIVGLSIVQVTVSNSLSTTGIELAKIEDQIDAYKKENAKLSEELLTVSSFDTIASKAAAMGFVEEKKHLVLTSPLPIAAKP
jgi:cell division protein FtsL